MVYPRGMDTLKQAEWSGPRSEGVATPKGQEDASLKMTLSNRIVYRRG